MTMLVSIAITLMLWPLNLVHSKPGWNLAMSCACALACASQCTCILQVKLPVGKVQYVVMEPTRVFFHLES